MGSWGPGNLESDGAQDALTDICDQLFERIIELLNHPRSHEYDDEEIHELLVRIEMVFALSERDMINSTPDPKELKPLLKSYHKRWSDYFKSNGDHPPSDQSKLLKDSFKRLMDIAKGKSEGSFLHRIGLISDKMEKSD